MADENEWGIPDWRDPDTYGDWCSWRRERWRWEFCRRENELRRHFDQQAKRLAEAPSKDADFEAFIRTLPFVNPSSRVQRKFGYFILPNPRLSAEPKRKWLKIPQPLSVPPFKPEPIRQVNRAGFAGGCLV